MNRYKVRHKILEHFKNEMDKSGVKVPVVKIDYDTYCRSIKGLKPDEVSTYLIIMKEEGYFNFDKVADNNYEVQIKKKGLIDFADKKFIRKKNRILIKNIKEWAITVANVSVAIIAIIALQKPNEIKQLEAELQQINSRLLKVEDSATPSTLHQLYNYQSTQKNFSKHSSTHF
jgi:hypothetical protein